MYVEFIPLSYSVLYLNNATECHCQCYILKTHGFFMFLQYKHFKLMKFSVSCMRLMWPQPNINQEFKTIIFQNLKCIVSFQTFLAFKSVSLHRPHKLLFIHVENTFFEIIYSTNFLSTNGFPKNGLSSL